MPNQDILLDQNYDLDISNGDFNVGLSDEQHLVLLVELFEGDLKQYPLQCVGIDQYSGSSGQGAFIQNKIKVKAQSDRYQNVQIILKQQQDGTFVYNLTADA